MFYEYAINPDILSDPFHREMFFESFNCHPSRLISDVPRLQWRKAAREAIDQIPHEECRTVYKKKLKNDLDKLIRSNLSSNRCSKNKQKNNNAWLELATSEHKKYPFSAIFTTHLKDISSPYFSFKKLSLESPLCWTNETDKHVYREAQALVELISPLLKLSRKIILIDPHFSFMLPRWKDGYQSLLKELINKSSNYNFGSGINTIEIHISDKKHYKNLQATVEEKVKPLLKNNISVECFIWPDNQMHDRFILTDIGGVSFGYGLDEATYDSLDEVLASVLGYEAYRVEKAKIFNAPKNAIDSASVTNN